MKESFYFSHDFNAHDDMKMRNLIRIHGLEAYGVFWYLIELMAGETGKWYLKKDYEALAYELRVDFDLIKSVVEDFELFEFDNNNFWSKRLDEHFKKRAEISKKARENAKKRWSKKTHKTKKKIPSHCKNDATALQKECNSNAIKERKGKEKKKKKEINLLKKIDVYKIFQDQYYEIFKRRVIVLSNSRKRKIDILLKHFTQDQIFKSWQIMSKVSYLRGENDSGIDYATFDYAVRSVEIIEKYLTHKDFQEIKRVKIKSQLTKNTKIQEQQSKELHNKFMEKYNKWLRMNEDEKDKFRKDNPNTYRAFEIKLKRDLQKSQKTI